MDNRDEHLWRIAKKRASFKKQLASYIIINGFLWALWWVTQGKLDQGFDDGGMPWPVWSTLGWGIGIAFSYYGAYHDDKETDTMREYNRLKEKDREKEKE